MDKTQLLTLMQSFFSESLKLTQKILEKLPVTQGSNQYDESSHYSSTSKASKSSRQKKPKIPRDPLAPKQAITAFFHFCKEKRPIFQQKFKEEKNTEIMKRIAESWKSLTVDKKSIYENIAQEDKKRYAREMALYLESKNNTLNKQTKAQKGGQIQQQSLDDSYGEQPVKKAKK